MRLGMSGDFARQREKSDRLFERQIGGRHGLRQRGALRLLAFAELHIGAEAAVAQRDLVAARRIDAEHFDARLFAVVAPPVGAAPTMSA